MDIISRIKKMREIRKCYRFTATEQALFYELVAISVREKSETVCCSNTDLCAYINIGTTTLKRARANLIRSNLIRYTSGNNKRNVGKYSFVDLNKADTNTDPKADTISISPDKGLSKNKPHKKLAIPPSLEEVKTYCLERQNGIDPQHFIDFYSARGWMIGKNKMKDWKASVRTWEQNRKKNENRSDNSKPKDYTKGF